MYAPLCQYITSLLSSTPPPPATTSPLKVRVEYSCGNVEYTTACSTQYQSHRAHWARAQARAERYEEEVMLTVEEMGRNLKYFEWKKSWWQSILSEQAQSNDPPPPIVQDGLHTYAHRQADIYDRLVTLFVNHWHSFLSAHSLGSSWLGNYPLSAHPAPHAGPRRGH